MILVRTHNRELSIRLEAPIRTLDSPDLLIGGSAAVHQIVAQSPSVSALLRDLSSAVLADQIEHGGEVPNSLALRYGTAGLLRPARSMAQAS